jgi:hypothetical protein
MKDISAIASVKEDRIRVYLCNLVPTDMIEYGHVLPQSGKEQLLRGVAKIPASLPDEPRYQ